MTKQANVAEPAKVASRSVRTRGYVMAGMLLAVGSPVLKASAQSASENTRCGGKSAEKSNPVMEIDELVRRNFYSLAALEKAHWSSAVAKANAEVSRACDSAMRTRVIRDLLAKLETSHTAFYPREDPAYWEMASIFEPVLKRSCEESRTPGFPITHASIGVFWRQVGTAWFVAGVYAKGPAEQAGLKVGDEVVSVQGHPFSPVSAFKGQEKESLLLGIRRKPGESLMKIRVQPRAAKPHDELRDATADSWRILERKGKKIAYLRIWSWTSQEIHRAVINAIGKSNAAGAEAFIVDLRDGWGGASPEYISLFDKAPPVLESIERDGTVEVLDSQIRKPAIVLVNGGTRSGKEAIAFGLKKHSLARLVGQRTAGAVAFGQPFCLKDGSLLYLAVLDARVDGERLEGRGVEPDVNVPFEFRYSAGQDEQFDRALDVLSGE
jgi:carboxyl-terminal processing protease